MENWINNLRLLYDLIQPARCVTDLKQVPAHKRWAGLIFLPAGLTEREALAHRDLQQAEIIGGWPLIAAFDNDEDFILAKLRFA